MSTLNDKRHSLAHLLASAVIEQFPQAKLGVGPTIETGFYYDFQLPQQLKPEDLPKLEKRMKHLIKQNLAFEREDKTFSDAKTFFEERNQPFKVELIGDIQRHGTTDANEISQSASSATKPDSSEPTNIATTENEPTVNAETVSIYTTGNFIDLCRGGHVENTKELDPDSFKLDKISGAYWRGDEKNPMLTRIYGLAFETKAELDAHLAMIEEAHKRDHRKLGQELDLFTFSDLVGAGLPLFTPKGTILRMEIQNRLFEISRKYDMLPVTIPHIAKLDLYETSGHAAKFGDELFKVSSHYNQEFVMKPVNCPHHTQIYASRPRSYRDLPLRYMESTMQYRDEKPGEIGGLTRVRAITVDDGHIFCRVDQIKKEAQNIAEIIKEFYSSFGMYGDHWVSLSLRDSAHPEKYIGDESDWKQAEQMLKDVSDEMNLKAKRMEGEAALYGPKLDYMFKDSLGKERQLATIQIDFAMPKRFKITYTDSDGSQKYPIIIHRAILGSYERFMAILIEHFAGAFPTWLSPVQATIVTVSDKQNDFAEKVLTEIKAQIPLARIELDLRSESMGKRIRESSKQKVPYILIMGDKEIESNSVSVRGRGDVDLGTIPVIEFIGRLQREINDKS